MRKLLILLITISLLFLANVVFAQSIVLTKHQFDSVAVKKGYSNGNIRINKVDYSVTFLKDSVRLIPYRNIVIVEPKRTTD